MRSLLPLFLLTLTVSAQSSDLFEGELDGKAIVYRVSGGYAVYQDDILLGPVEKPSGQRNTSFFTGNLWPEGLVPYEIDPAIPASTVAQTQQAINIWNGYGTPIHLQPRSGETDFVRFTRSTANSGVCSSFVGRRGGSQAVTLEDFCAASSIIHEIGHAVGMWHEQSRADRNHNVTVLYENIAKDRANNYNIEPLGQDLGGYEYSSSMHYRPFSFSVDNKQTMESVPPGIPMGESFSMNAGDLDSVSRKYGVVPEQTTISSNPLGLILQVDGQLITTPRVFAWSAGSQHTIGVPPVAQSDAGLEYRFGKWSDGGAQSHEIVSNPDVTVYTANFVRRVPVVLLPQPGGTVAVNPASTDGFYPPYSQIKVTATPSNGFRFYRWGSTAGFSCNGSTTSANPLVLPPRIGGYGCAPIFTQSVVTTIDSDPPGQFVIVDGFSYQAPINFTFVAGSSHSISASTPGAGFGSRVLFADWSDGGPPSHSFTALAEGGTITARFVKQYLLTLQQPFSALGRIVASPSSFDGYYDAGTVVSVQTTLNTGYSLLSWFGDLVGRTNPSSVVMDDQHLVGAAILPSTGVPAVTVIDSLTFQSFFTISPGEIVSLFGTGLGPVGGIGPTIDSTGKVATQSGGTRVLFDGKPAPIVYASPGQVNVVVPYGVGGPRATQVVAEFNGVQKPPTTMSVTPVLPAIVSNGAGRAVVVNQDGNYNSPDHPAKRGSVIVFFATGEGATNPAGIDGRVGAAPLARPVAPVFVRVGGKPAQVQYAGNAPGFVAGAMQVNALIPDDAPSGEVSIYLIVGTTASPPITKISVE
jgi:uncharacterized protein (TIGR03437 family)